MKYGVLNENHLFVKTYHKGKKVVCKRIVLFVLEDKHARLLKKSHPQKKEVNRVGISATKKVGGAVERNRAKRIIRQAWRDLSKKYPFVTGKLIVISAREACNGAKSTDVLKDLTYAASKLGLFAADKPKNENSDKV